MNTKNRRAGKEAKATVEAAFARVGRGCLPLVVRLVEISEEFPKNAPVARTSREGPASTGHEDDAAARRGSRRIRH